MSDSHIYAKIRQYLTQNIENVHPNSPASNTDHLYHLTHQMPHLTPQQIRAICKLQEQNILEKVLPIKPFDLYQEIAKVCPSERDLKIISADQVTSRLNLYNSKLILTERPTVDYDSSESWEESKSETFFGEVNFGMFMIEENNNEGEENRMIDIFEECDMNCWNANEQFGLS